MNSRNKKIIFIIAVVIVAIGLFAFVCIEKMQSNAVTPDGYVLIDTFNYAEPGGVSCTAVSPECGDCFGVIIEKNCYMTQEDKEKYGL